ncbi:hypothetical protein ANO11243_009890 [Dothideomycetidae sp. 11243]|nr:hypothetical protein ANO11243_009890 [fungal sp. No.11243]
MPSLETRPLGREGPPVPVPGFGAMTIGFYGEPIEDRLRILDAAYEAGCRFWDTAAAYGDSETLIGEWFQRTGKRNEIFIATKFGLSYNNYVMKAENDPKDIRKSVEESLKKLRVDSIDLLYCHRIDSNVPIENTVKAMSELQAEGKIKYLGLSEASSATLERASKVAKISALQIEYSPFSMDIENPDVGVLQTCRSLGIAVVAYSPLGRGFITGAYKSRADLPEEDYRRNYPRFSEENFDNNLQLVRKFQDVAKEKNHTPGQVALAWLMAQGDDIIPIPGTRKLKYLQENIGTAGVKLSSSEVEMLRKAVVEAEVAGNRAGEGFDLGLFADTVEP